MNKSKLSEIIAIEELKVPRFTLREANPTFLPIHLTGGIGDAILAIPTLVRLRDEGYKLVVYSRHAKALKYFYGDAPIVKEDPMPLLTWHLEIDSIARFKFSTQFGGFLLECHRNLFEQQKAFFQKHPDIEWLVHQHPKHKYLLTRRAAKLGYDAEYFPVYCLGFEGPTLGFVWPPRKAPENHITIHDGYDANYSVPSGRATKQWPINYWNELVLRLKQAFPGYGIIQLGSTTARPISGTTNLIGKTTITEAFDIIAKSRLHIDTDSGLAHAATALGVPCVVMFGPTPASFYGHPQNVNISNEKSCEGGCFHLTEGWMAGCPIGYYAPLCIDDITATHVMERVRELLG